MSKNQQKQTIGEPVLSRNLTTVEEVGIGQVKYYCDSDRGKRSLWMGIEC